MRSDPKPCGCSCHTFRGVKHMAACCSAPSRDHIERVAELRREYPQPKDLS